MKEIHISNDYKDDWEHIECISDFCGNYKTPGHWADLWKKPDGSRAITLGGWWQFFAERTPSLIEETDPLFHGFLDACEKQEDITFVEEHWS